MNIFTGFSTKRKRLTGYFYYLCNRIKPMGESLNRNKTIKIRNNEKKTISASTCFHLALPDVCSRKDKAQF